MSRCKICGVKKTGHTDFCRTHKHAMRRAVRRVREEALIVDQAGGSWWVWDARGDVLVAGEGSKAAALCVLVSGDPDAHA